MKPRAQAEPASSEALITRFLSHVDKLPSGCWFWNGARSSHRGRKLYGSFNHHGKVIRAHIFAHDHLAGKACPEGWHRDHLCGFSLCVNPDHIVAVPAAENVARVRESRWDKLIRLATLGWGDKTGCYPKIT